MGVFYVYGVFDSREPERIRYVGKTTGKVSVRLINHWTYSRKPGRLPKFHSWLKSRADTPEVVKYRVLDTANTLKDLNDLEMHHIAEHRKLNQADLNHTQGGEGMLGYTRSEESRKSISDKYRASGGPSAKLNWPLVNEIRSSRKRVYEAAIDIAQKFGVQRTVIDRILKNQLWFDPDFNPNDIVKRPPGMHVAAKLSMDDVREIREMRSEIWVPARALAEEFGVSEPAILGILRNRTYRDPTFDPSRIIARPR